MGERSTRACAAGAVLAIALTGCASSGQGSVAAGTSATAQQSSTSSTPAESAVSPAKDGGDAATGDPAPGDDGRSGGSAAPAEPADPTAAAGGAGSAGADNVAWMENFCGEVLGIRGLKDVQQPQVRNGATAQNHKEISAYIGRLIDVVSATVDGMKGLPQAPVPAGDKAVRNFRKIVVSAQDSLRSVKAELDRAAPTNEQAISEALKGVRSVGQELQKDTHPFKVLNGSGLIDAAKKAPSCTKLV